MQVYQVLEQIAATSSRNEKISILEQNDSEILRDVLHQTYNPFITFGVNKVLDVVPMSIHTLESMWSDIKEVLNDLALRRVTGNLALEVVAGVMESLTPEDAEVFRNILRKDQRCGLADKTINKVYKKLIPTFELMLASQQKNSKVKFPCGIEIKYDGLRCAAIYDGQSVQFLSRAGKPFDTLDFLSDDVIEYLDNKPGMLDGELMGDDFNSTVSGVKRKGSNESTESVKFYVYDQLTIEEFREQKCSRTRSERYDWLQERGTALKLDKSSRIQVVQALEVHSIEESEVLFHQFMKDGHEGAILKDWDGVYEFKRVRTISKMKPSETADCPIIGFDEGAGKYEGMLGAFVVEFEGKECRVGTGLSDEQRVEFWNRKSELVDQLIEVAYMERTESISEAGGSMRHPVFKGFRSFKGAKV